MRASHAVTTVFLVLSVALARAQQPGVGASAPATEDVRDRILYANETESIKPLAHKFVTNIFYDQKAIWASPFHINRHEAGWWILFGGATAAFIATDHTTSKQLPNTLDQITFSRHVSQLGAEYTVLPVLGGFYLFGALTDNGKARETALLGSEAAIDSVIVFEVLKTVTQRPRPLEKGGAGRFFKGGDSFPSGHAMSIWTVASVVGHEYGDHKLVPIVAYSLATLVSASRFSARKHFASDVVAGSALGYFIGRYVVNTHDEHAGHVHNRMLRSLAHPRILPEVQPSAGLYGVGVNWSWN